LGHFSCLKIHSSVAWRDISSYPPLLNPHAELFGHGLRTLSKIFFHCLEQDSIVLSIKFCLQCGHWWCFSSHFDTHFLQKLCLHSHLRQHGSCITSPQTTQSTSARDTGSTISDASLRLFFINECH